MSFAAELPWSEHEKVYLLAEILKEGRISSETLLALIEDHGIEPRFAEIPLPFGRSLRSCQNAYNDLASSARHMSAENIQAHPSPQALHSSLASTSNPRKRPLPPKEPSSGARTLQPRPPAFQSINGQNLPPFHMSPGDDQSGPPKKKRGRPSKVEAEARAAAAAARGEVYPLPRTPKQPKAPAASGPSSGSAMPGGAEAQAAGQAMTTAIMTDSSPMAPGPDSESASKAKKKGRTKKEEGDTKRLLLEAAAVAASANPAGPEMEPHQRGEERAPVAERTAGHQPELAVRKQPEAMRATVDEAVDADIDVQGDPMTTQSSDPITNQPHSGPSHPPESATIIRNN
ncbi:MAG: hypothetical protein M1817_006472 [Caeruleum heppii]|nr:MAG: hypothetical protein M1817_006472 [Caeruleum heppii]